jgi:hypothetical protein
MHTDNLIINHCTTGQAIKGVAKLFPHFHGKATATFVVEAIDTINTSAFMVTSQQEKVFRVFNFVGKQKTDHFQGLFSTVHIIT